MKKALVALGLIIAGAANSLAWEYPRNPDRFPSIGLNLTGESATGDIKYPSAPALGSQDFEGSGSSLMLDTRLPLSNSFTLNIAIGGASSEIKGEETSVFNSSTENTSSGIFSIGFRYYFNK